MENSRNKPGKKIKIISVALGSCLIVVSLVYIGKRLFRPLTEVERVAQVLEKDKKNLLNPQATDNEVFGARR